MSRETLRHPRLRGVLCPGNHYRRWGNSLAVRLPTVPTDCLCQAGLREGDQIEIVVGPDGRLSL